MSDLKKDVVGDVQSPKKCEETLVRLLWGAAGSGAKPLRLPCTRSSAVLRWRSLLQCASVRPTFSAHAPVRRTTASGNRSNGRQRLAFPTNVIQREEIHACATPVTRVCHLHARVAKSLQTRCRKKCDLHLHICVCTHISCVYTYFGGVCAHTRTILKHRWPSYVPSRRDDARAFDLPPAPACACCIVQASQHSSTPTSPLSAHKKPRTVSSILLYT